MTKISVLKTKDPKELEVVKVIFVFKGGSQKVLRGEELEDWKCCQLLQSDYSLPINKSSKFYKGGIIRGFTPCPKL